MIKLTFVVLVWNEVKTIKKAIKDVQKIKYSNKEIIVIDNKSTDGTREILKKIKKTKKIKIIYRKKILELVKVVLQVLKKPRVNIFLFSFLI